MDTAVRIFTMSLAFSAVSMVITFLVTLFVASIIPWFRRLSKLSIFLAFLGAWALTALVMPSMSLEYFMENTGHLYYLQAAMSVVILTTFRAVQRA